MVRVLTGGLPEPGELFGREHLIECVWAELESSNIYLVAPRRFGKSGVMRHLLKQPRTGFLPVSLDVEDIHSGSEFASRLAATLLAQDKIRAFLVAGKALPKKAVTFLKEHVESLSLPETIQVKFKEAVGADWESVVRALVLELEQTQDTIVFCIDEFPQCVDNICRKSGAEDAIAFLLWFRSLRLRQKDELRRHRFVLAGSTGIDLILRRLNVADKLNDCARLAVDVISDEAAAALLDQLSVRYGVKFAGDGRQRFFDLIGPRVPYFVQIFFAEILHKESLKGRVLTSADVESLYHERILGPTCRAYFEPYRQRLKERYGPKGEKAAAAILGQLAESCTGRESDAALYAVYADTRKTDASEVEFREIMADLECDWYVVLDPKTNEYFFRLNVMRDWWKRFYGRLKPGR